MRDDPELLNQQGQILIVASDIEAASRCFGQAGADSDDELLECEPLTSLMLNNCRSLESKGLRHLAQARAARGSTSCV